MRERFRLITPYWLLYPEGIGVITEDSNFCGTEEGRFNVCFTEGDTGKSAHFHSFFPRVLEIAQPEHDILHERFHVTHFAGCATLFNKDIFYPDIGVKSICLHDTRRDLPDQIMEGDQGWVTQGVLSRASFRRSAVSGQRYFTVLSLHISIIQTLRAIMISQEVDLVTSDFNGTAWCCRSRDNLSTIEDAFSDCALPTPPGTTPLWGPGSITNNWADVCGFLKPTGSQRFWKVNKHGAFFHPLASSWPTTK